jgi:hypothetical protein
LQFSMFLNLILSMAFSFICLFFFHIKWNSIVKLL